LESLQEQKMGNSVTIEIKNHVAELTLNRPEKHNAVDLAMFEALIEAGDSLAGNKDVRAVVMHGAGDNFCAGIDLSVFQGAGLGGLDQNAFKPRDGSPANFFQSAAYVWRELPMPVIAAINGVAFGAGLQIALGADIRYAAPNARLSIMEIKWGIIPDMAITATLRDIMPADRAKELAFTGRIVAGSEAESIGLITSVHEKPLDAARNLAAEIAGKSPDAIRAIKTLVNESWQGPVESALRSEARLQLGLLGKPNQAEAVAANLQKRAPNFQPVASPD
jgi:enoyl-CoA hydratase/carnithine racemase